MKRSPIEDDGIYNIIRSQAGQKTIFKERLPGRETRRQLKHWKNMARNSGGNVYFEAVPVPPDVIQSVTSVAA